MRERPNLRAVREALRATRSPAPRSPREPRPGRRGASEAEVRARLYPPARNVESAPRDAPVPCQGGGYMVPLRDGRGVAVGWEVYMPSVRRVPD